MAASHPDPDIELDNILCRVANNIPSNDHIERLGKRLGFTPVAIKRFLETNLRGLSVTAEGTKDMLRQWAAGQSVSETLPKLQAALKDAGLVQIAEMHVPDSLSSLTEGLFNVIQGGPAIM